MLMRIWILVAFVSIVPRPTLLDVSVPWDPPTIEENGTDELMWKGFFTNHKEKKSYRLFMEQPLSWRQAYEHCKKWRSHLVVIDNPIEHEDVVKLITPLKTIKHSYRKLFHAGYTQQYHKDLIIQIFGAYSTWTEWSPTVHNNDALMHPAKDRCMALDYEIKIMPVHCDNEKLPFVCERCEAVPLEPKRK